MQRWEHLVVQEDGLTDQKWVELGAAGWELAAVDFKRVYSRYIFKRPVPIEYEYQVLVWHQGRDNVNQLAAAGWEFVVADTQGSHAWVFRRPKP